MRYHSTQYTRLLGILLIAIFLSYGCATKRKKGETSKVGLFFHNLNSKYNGYFNADELVNNSLVRLEENSSDNYYQLLNVYTYTDPSSAKVISPDMDVAIEKVTTVATLHEPSHWVDDCYVLMGKAQFLKQDFETAEETLEYFQEEFDPGNPFSRTYDKNKGKKSAKDIKKQRAEEKKAEKKQKEEERKAKEEARKKEKERREKEAKEKKKRSKKRSGKKRRATKKTKVDSTTTAQKSSITKTSTITEPEEEKDQSTTESAAKKITRYPKGDAGLFGHAPAFYDGLLWLSKTYIEREKYSYAEYLLNKLENEYPSSKDVIKQIPATKAHLFIKQKKYAEAITFLEMAIEMEKNKRYKARYAFIIAQIYQQNNQSSQALENFERVKKYKPSYEMEFNTTLNIAMLKNASSKKSKRSVVNDIESLLEEAKYLDFHDQIYYALGVIRYNNDDTPGALEAFQKSIEVSSGNSIQQTETYYRLGNLLYQKSDYVAAKSNFDKALKVMDKNDSRYLEVQKYAKTLTDIAANSQLIEEQDSLLAIAYLDENDRLELAKTIWEREKENPDSELNKVANENNLESQIGNIRRSGLRGTSSFFAYNTASKIKGQQSFNRKWGERTLEDNWRRTDKFGSADQDNENEDNYDNEDSEEELTDAILNRIFKDVPLSKEQQKSSNQQIEKALFDLGVDFRDAIQNYAASIQTLETLETRYPRSKYELDAFYYQYLSFTDTNNRTKAEAYKNKIITDYPDSKYAKILLDPSYAAELRKAEKSLEEFYNTTYDLFLNKEYNTVQNRIEKSKELYPADNKLNAKFALLRAMTIGNIEGKEAYISALREVSTRYPNTPENTRAKEIMRFLRGDTNAFDKALYSEALEMFKADDNKLHYVIAVVYDSNEAKKRDAKVAISRYNKKYHKLDKLRITDIYLNAQDKTQIILVRKFKNKKKAMDYFNQVDQSRNEYIDKNVSYDLFAVTQKNYREIIKQKSVKNYALFFEENYIKNKSSKK